MPKEQIKSSFLKGDANVQISPSLQFVIWLTAAISFTLWIKHQGFCRELGSKFSNWLFPAACHTKQDRWAFASLLEQRWTQMKTFCVGWPFLKGFRHISAQHCEPYSVCTKEGEMWHLMSLLHESSPLYIRAEQFECKGSSFWEKKKAPFDQLVDSIFFTEFFYLLLLLFLHFWISSVLKDCSPHVCLHIIVSWNIKNVSDKARNVFIFVF